MHLTFSILGVYLLKRGSWDINGWVKTSQHFDNKGWGPDGRAEACWASVPPGSLTAGLWSERTECEDTAFKLLSSPTVLRSHQRSQVMHAGSSTSVGQPSSLQQAGCLAPLSLSLGCSLCLVISLIIAECPTSFPSGQQDVSCRSRLTMLTSANVEFSAFFLSSQEMQRQMAP